MNRSDVIKDLEWIIADSDIDYKDKTLRVLAYIEDIGMLPPVGKVTLKPDPDRAGKFIHTEAKREWDDEET